MVDLDKAIAEVIGTFDGVEEISAEQREGIVNYIQRKARRSCRPAMENHCCSSLLPGICRALNKEGGE